MRNAVVVVPDLRTEAERGRLLRVAVRQLDRADLYLVAVGGLDLGDDDASSAIEELRENLEGLRQHLLELQAET